MQRAHSIIKGNTLTMDQIRKAAPAAFAEKPSDKVSERYGYVPTLQVIEEFLGNGFVVTQARGGIRGASRTEGAHEIRLRSPDDKLRAGNYFSEIVFSNSHDGSSPATFNHGLYRVACDNGLIVPSADSSDLRRIHSKFSMRDIMGMAEVVIGKADKVEQVVERWRGRELTSDEFAQFVYSAEILAYGAVRAGMSQADWRRAEDAGNDLWTVFNRVQENILTGGVIYRNSENKRRVTRPIASMARSRKVNLGLWRNAELILPS